MRKESSFSSDVIVDAKAQELHDTVDGVPARSAEGKQAQPQPRLMNSSTRGAHLCDRLRYQSQGLGSFTARAARKSELWMPGFSAAVSTARSMRPRLPADALWLAR